MKFTFNKNGTLKSYEQEMPLIQSSENAYQIKVLIEDDNINDYVGMVEYKRADKQTSGDLALSVEKVDGENCFVGVVPSWATQVEGVLQITIRLYISNGETRIVKAFSIQNEEVLSATSYQVEVADLSEEQYDSFLQTLNSKANKTQVDDLEEKKLDKAEFDDLKEKKLDKAEFDDLNTYVYATQNKNQQNIKVSQNVEAMSIVQRDFNGQIKGVANLDKSGKIPSDLFPSSVDEIIEGILIDDSHFAKDGGIVEPLNDKIYVDINTNKTYRWSGSSYVEISQGVVIGETSQTAFAGDRGVALEENVDELNQMTTYLEEQVSMANADISYIEGHFVKNDAVDPNGYIEIKQQKNNYNSSLLITENGMSLTSYQYSPSYISQGIDITPFDILLKNTSWSEIVKKVNALYGGYVDFYTETSVAHIKVVPENALSYASINKIGGMTYLEKNENLCILEDVEETTENGITYSVKGGVIKAKGTNTKESTFFLKFYFKDKKDIKLNGTYSQNWFYRKISGDINYIRYEKLDEGATGTSTIFVYENGTTKTPTESLTTTLKHITISIKTGLSIDITSRPMLVEGDVIPVKWKKGFEPYFVDTKVNEVKLYKPNLLRKKITGKSGAVYDYTVDDEGWITLNVNMDLYTGTGKGTSIPLFGANNSSSIVAYAGKTYTARIIFKDNKIVNIGSLVIAQTVDKVETRFATIGYSQGSPYLEFTGLSEVNINYLYLWISLDSGAHYISNAQFKIELIEGDGKPTYLLPIPETIKNLEGYGLGINNEVYNYIDFENNKFVKKVESVKLKDLDWQPSTMVTEVDRFFAYLPSTKRGLALSQILSDMSNIKTPKIDYNIKTENTMFLNTNIQLIINLGAYRTTTLEEFKARLSEEDPILVYQLETPIELSIEEIDNIIPVKSGQEVEFSSDNNRAVPSEIMYEVKVGGNNE